MRGVSSFLEEILEYREIAEMLNLIGPVGQLEDWIFQVGFN